MKNMLWAVFLVGLELGLAEVTILKIVQTLYDRSPKLRIKGSGFDADEHSILLTLSAQGQPSLKLDKDYLITKDDDGIILKLLTNRRWVNLEGRNPPVALILSAVMFSSNPTVNLMQEPIIIANVVPTPTVETNMDIIYTTASNELRINGTGFMGVKKVDLYFNPPLFKDIAYQMVSPFPLVRNEVVLRLRGGYQWREEPGPLSVVGIDTGGGAVKLNGEEGIRVAEVHADLELHGATVETTATQQLIYHDEANIMIAGAKFNPQGNVLRFANGILGKGVNYTVTATSETSISMRLVTGSQWRKNVENLPGYLTLLAINAGEGFVAVGPTNAAKGRDVATVFERPNVHSSDTQLKRTQSHELHLKGAGFTKVLGKTQLKFSPELEEGVDYTILVIDRSELEVTLLDRKGWRRDEGPLLITAINTRGDEAGWVKVGGTDGVHVAQIVNDIDADTTGGIEVFQMGVKVYQSSVQDTIVIAGRGFKEGMSFNFEPDIKDKVDFDMEIANTNKIVLKLKEGKKWSASPGFIIAKSVVVGGKKYSLAGLDGIRVAVVLQNPTVKPGKDSFHETQSKVIAISGTGFTTVAETKISLRPTTVGAYKILNVLEDTIRVQLKQDFDWLPSFMSLKDLDTTKKIPLQVTGIDTGAGEVVFAEPITVGFVVQDRAGVICDDSCEYAFDGVCDDGTEGEYDQYYETYGYYQDDDFGGYYGGEDGTEGAKDGAGGSYAEGYGEEYDDYYMENDTYHVSACVEGTDCTDCGGVDAIVDYTKAPEAGSGVETCTNTCEYSRDGVCDDPRGANYCKLGTDCQDCGPVGADNFTRSDDDGWWDDDDDYWTFNDGSFLDQTKGLEANRHRVKVVNKTDNSGPAAMFLVVLEGMVYTVGAIFAAAALYLGMRWYKGQSVPFMNVFNPDSQMHQQDLEMMPSRRMPITPDVIRT